MKTKLLYVASFVLLTAPAFVGCAPQGPYNTYGSRDYGPAYDSPSSATSYDDQHCRRVADDYSGRPIEEVGKGALIGGALGAAAGAAGGAIAGDAGKGAAIGAATGGIGGAVVQGARRHERYNEVYASCMRDRGHSVY